MSFKTFLSNLENCTPKCFAMYRRKHADRLTLNFELWPADNNVGPDYDMGVVLHCLASKGGSMQ